MQNSLALGLFHLMFDEARRTQPPGRERLSLLLGVSLESVAGALDCLEGRGLVDAGRARLTLHGLAVAAATRPVAAGRASRSGPARSIARAA